MGVEKFFNSLKSTYNIISPFNDKLKTKHLFFDFNSIIHVISQYVLHDLNSILYDLSNDNPLEDNIISYYDINRKLLENPNEFYDYYNYENVTNLIIYHVKKYLLKIIKKFDNLELIYIGLDGVPTYAKMLEQKKRRFNAYFFGKIIKYKNNNKIIKWSKVLISPGTSFMIYFQEQLKDFNLDQFCKKLIISDSQIPGEAEYKIFKYIKDNSIKNICIYSPDADLILMSLLQHNTNITILRFDQQKSTSPNNFHFDMININNLYDSILDYYKDDIINDIVFIFTFFGNDFLPKLQSFNANLDIQLIIDSYKDFHQTYKKCIIIKNQLNIDNFKLFIESLLDIEIILLNRNKLIDTYTNYLNLVSQIDPNNKYHFIELNEIEQFIKDYNMSRIKDAHFDIIPGDLDKFTTDNYKFIKYNKKLHHIKINNVKLLALFINNHSSKEGFHKQRMLELSDDHKEIYKLENLLDDYYVRFDKKDDNNGDIDLYIQGLYWLVDYYYNFIINNAWYYPYNNHFTLQNIYDKLPMKNNLKINSKDFTIDEQLMFVTPLNILYNDDNVNIKLKKNIKEKDLEKEDNLIDTINCHGAKYFNKCFINFDTKIKGGKLDYYRKLYKKTGKFIHKYKYLKYKSHKQ